MRLVQKAHKYFAVGQQKAGKPKILLVLLCAAIVIFFIPLLVKLLLLKKIPASVMPPEFNLGSIVLIAGSWLLHRSQAMMKNDDIRYLKICLCTVLVAGLFFLLLQYHGWMHIYFSLTSPDIRIMMVMVAAHAVLFLGALLLLLSVLIPLFPVKSRWEAYMYFLDDKNTAGFYANNFYWNFLGVLWIAIYCVMLCKSI
jgi:cytochrome c oxidase subunit III